MVLAIQSDNVDFVELLLDNGVNIETFLTIERLLELYNGERKSETPFSDLLLSLRKKKKKIELTKEIIMENVGELITHLLDDCYLQQYSSNQGKDETEDETEKETEDKTEDETEDETEDKTKDETEDETEKETEDKREDETEDETEDKTEDETEKETENKTEDETQDETEDKTEDETDKETEDKTEDETEDETDDKTEDETKDKKEDSPFENPFLHLLIWAVLNNLQDMAKLFWRKGKDSIAAALLAHALLSAMARRLKTARPNLHEDIEANSREFMDLAAGVLEKCYRSNENYARALLIGDLLHWEKASCILIAMKTKNKTFMSAKACHEVFNNVWMGKMTQKNGILKLLICMFIPPLIPLCVQFKDNKDNEPDPGDDTSDTVQEEQATGVSSPNVSLQQSDPLLQSESGEETSNDSEGNETKLMKYFRRAKIPLFYRAPVVHFLSHAISYMAFLCLYSYILITKFDQNVSVEEGILIAWVVHIFIEEIHQVIATRYIYTEIKLKAYIADFWNIADILMILLFVIGIILKHLPHQETLEAARVVLGVNLVLYFLRLLQIFSLNKELGPKLVMIIRMVRNLTSFFVMLLIFIVAYAIASHAILYPNTEISFNLLRVIFRRPYWNIYGELMLDEIEGANDCTNIVELYQSGTQPRCPTESGKYVVPVLMGVYMLMCNILLLNLLISIFSNTFKRVQKKADMHWRVQRYHQIQEYITRSMFVPIYSFIVDVSRIILFLKRCLCRCKPENDTSGTNVFLQPFSDEELRRDAVREWERGIAQDFINSTKADLESIDNSVTEIKKRLEQMDSKIDALQDQQHTGTATIGDNRLCRSQTKYQAESESITVDEPGSGNLDQRIDNIEKKLKWMIDTHKEHQHGAEEASPEKTDERVEVQPSSNEDLPDTVRKWERTIAQDNINSNKADLKSIDDSVKAITLRLDQLFSKIDSLEEQQHALTATIENARLHPSQTDCVAKSESSTVDEPGSVTLDQRMDNREEQIPRIVDTPEEH